MRRVVEWRKDLRPISREQIDENVRPQREKHEERCFLNGYPSGMHTGDEPAEQRGENHGEQQSMRKAAMPGELRDRIEQRVRKHVEIGQRAAEHAPKRRLVAEFAVHRGLSDRRTESDLCDKIHGLTAFLYSDTC
jgi:hypothetical protein